MSDSEYSELREASWRRNLSAAEQEQVQAYWLSHPDAQADWEEDEVLTRQLRKLPDVPIASNFTALVLQALDAEENRQRRAGGLGLGWSAWLRRFAPRVALAGLTVLLGVSLLFQNRHEAATRKQVARDVFVEVTTAVAPGPEVFEDFDAIQQLKHVAFSSTSADDDLVAALQ